MSLAGSPIDECVQKCMINDGRVSMHLEMEEIEERTREKGPITWRGTIFRAAAPWVLIEPISPSSYWASLTNLRIFLANLKPSALAALHEMINMFDERPTYAPICISTVGMSLILKNIFINTALWFLLAIQHYDIFFTYSCLRTKITKIFFQ